MGSWEEGKIYQSLLFKVLCYRKKQIASNRAETMGIVSLFAMMNARGQTAELLTKLIQCGLTKRIPDGDSMYDQLFTISIYHSHMFFKKSK